MDGDGTTGSQDGHGGRLRIQFVSTSLARAGAETQVVHLARRLVARGHRVGVVSLLDPLAFHAELVADGIDVVSLGMRRGQADPRALFRLARVVRRERPHVVHAHMVHANLVARLARPLAWAPVLVSTAHNIDEGGRASELAYRFTDRLTSVTTNVARAAVDRYVHVGAVPAGRIRYVPNGLDVATCRVAPGERARLRTELSVGDRFLWLAAGRLDVQKDYGVLLAAFANPPVPGRMLVIAGEGPLQRDLEAAAARLGLGPDAVRFLGQRPDVPSLLAAADGFVMSSAWEGLPMVLLEAAAAARPAVVTAVGGDADVVLHERTGLVVPAHDPPALAAAMRRVETLPEATRAAWGAAAYEHVATNFQLDRVVDLWLALYRELLAAVAVPTSRG
jgi:glycosyltransferase involved in cell wall biosynthesis